LGKGRAKYKAVAPIRARGGADGAVGAAIVLRAVRPPLASAARTTEMGSVFWP